MIKNKLRLIFITVFLITFSCKKKANEIDYEKKINNTDDFEVISIDVNKEEESINISDFIDNVSYIKLETNRNCIIGKIDKIEITENYIYILDRFSAKSLFVFKKNGDFFKKIGRIGNGPGEYSSIWDFCILNDKELFILDFSQNKLLFYKDFEFHKQKRLNTLVEFIIKNDSYYYSKPFKDVSLKVPDLIVQNSELKIVREEHYAPPFTKI